MNLQDVGAFAHKAVTTPIRIAGTGIAAAGVGLGGAMVAAPLTTAAIGVPLVAGGLWATNKLFGSNDTPQPPQSAAPVVPTGTAFYPDSVYAEVRRLQKMRDESYERAAYNELYANALAAQASATNQTVR